MTASDDLFQLIKAMTGNERRYCRLFLKQRIGKEAAGCLALFDEIAAQDSYDEAELRAKFSTARSTSHFAVMKIYLYTLVLKGLSAYRSDRSDRQRLRDMIEHAEILAEKGLYSQSRKMLRKARKIAAQNESLPEMAMIVQIEYRIDSENAYTGQSEASLDERCAEVKEILGKLENYLSYVDLSSRLAYSITWSGAQATSKVREKLDAIIAHPLFRSIEEATTVMAKTYYFVSYLTYYAHIGDFERGYRISQEYIEFTDSNERRGESFDRYQLHIYFFQFNFCMMLAKWREGYRAYQNICAAVKPSHNLYFRIKKEMTGVAFHMMLYDCAKVVELAPGIERFFAEHADEINHQTWRTFIAAVAYAHLMLENYTMAAETLHRLINYRGGEMRIDTFICGRLLQLIVHYELGNIELLPYLWRSAYYHIRKRDVLFPFEKAVLEFMRELPDVTTEKELIAGFERLKMKLIEIDADVPVDLVPWLESKIERRPLRDIVGERRIAYAKEIAGE